MRMQDTVMKLLFSQPFYGSLTSVISFRESKAVKKLKLSLFPDPVLEFNREWFEGLIDQQAIGALLHELMHLLLLHALRCGERDPLLWSVCCDIAVNEHILAEMLPPNSVTRENMEQKVQHKLEPFKSAEHYYQKISSLIDDSFSFVQHENMVTIPFSDGGILESDLQHEEYTSLMNERALQSKLHDLIDEARQGGATPQQMSGELDILYKRAQIDWKTMFKRFLTGKGRMQTRATYRRESRRHENYPGSKRSVGLRVLIALDESGSISNDQLQTFFNEVMALNKITNAEILVTEFDTQCTKPKPAQDYKHAIKREKSGGTDFRPIFELADSLKIPLVVIFTDGEGDAPKQVHQKVLWVLTKNGKQPAPYGYGVTFE